ncbi:PAAR-like domain-containing protein [Sorangium sp. So ce1014]|uniref:PAAR-like domain-containing protein n=1 Tax=Sorangium sp. So ce1014 TaxID=3133326 RepID=UPI003F62A75C
MPHFVFANGNEIASKSADGASLACQPDVCFSPGAPLPGLPVPYPNSVFARDLDNLSRTVFIKGTGAALEDKSYFSTSYGDEPATPGLKKGVITGTIKGKAYFRSWSMDVKVEGLGVARHMDTVTHNHVNQPNAMVQKYRSVWDKAPSCEQDRKQVEKNCTPKDQSKKPKRKGLVQRLGKVASVPDEMARKAYLYKRTAANAWVDDYCDGLWIKPSNKVEEFKKAKAEIEKFLNQDMWSLAQSAFGELMELAKAQLSPWFLLKKAGGLALRSVLKEGGALAAGATGVGLVVSAGLTAWTIADVISTATEIAEAIGPEGLEILADLKAVEFIEKMLKDKLKQWKENPTQFMADAMTALAAADACTRARKCMLVPYDKTIPASEAARSGAGCCPGQTGHHVMPGSMFGRRSNGTRDPAFATACAGGYDHGNAPTICLEGTTAYHGSHGVAHSQLRSKIEKYQAKQELAKKAGVPGANPDRMSYSDAKDAALDAIMFVAPHCSRKCLEARLDAYYTNCNKGNEKNLKPSYGGGRSLDTSDDGNDNNI